jgi:hypothetical protein
VLPSSDDGIRQCNFSDRAAGVSSHAVAVSHGAPRRLTLPTMNAAVSDWAPITLCKSTDSLMLLGLGHPQVSRTVPDPPTSLEKVPLLHLKSHKSMTHGARQVIKVA